MNDKTTFAGAHETLWTDLWDWREKHYGDRPWYVALSPAFWRDLAVDPSALEAVRVGPEEQRECEPFAAGRRWMGIPILLDPGATHPCRFFAKDEAFTRELTEGRQ